VAFNAERMCSFESTTAFIKAIYSNIKFSMCAEYPDIPPTILYTLHNSLAAVLENYEIWLARFAFRFRGCPYILRSQEGRRFSSADIFRTVGEGCSSDADVRTF